MLELDVILMPFLEHHFDSLDEAQQLIFSALLEQADPDLYSWLMGYDKSENEELQSMVTIVRSKIGLCP